jgi:predicted RecA/RadA family phage recombinase
METMKSECATHRDQTMAKNLQPGRVVTLVAPTGGVLSGQAVQVGALFGIAVFDAIGGANVEVALEGIWELPKAAVAVARGAPVFWDAAAGNVAADIGTGNALIGGATEARGTSDLTIRVRLNGDSVWGTPRRSGNGPPLAGTDKKIG